ncbi:L,D-transpeptidase [Thermosulfurimonas marina]|uniref:L,D-transpeptidase n=1 Tax=Thermosulfurimonas marina TaxID=2047767 RepID=A0A6H1WSM3_9BACT|nr:L,D-transpeptidase [Thermosulfurimonas marina]
MLFVTVSIFSPFWSGLGQEIPSRSRWVVVEKASRRVFLYEDGRRIAAFPCSLGLDPLSPKRARGDFATPEGLYRVREKHPSRRYFLFVGLDYPNLKDILLARWEGRISEREFREYLSAWEAGRPLSGPLGDGLGLHGGGLFRQKEGQRIRDWTHGCVALKNSDMERLYRFVSPGTPVLIYDRRKPLAQTLLELAPGKIRGPLREVRLRLALAPGLEADLLASSRRDGLLRLEVVGFSEGKVVFFLKDTNGNGHLEPLDRLWGRFPGGYPSLRGLILDTLPREVLHLVREGQTFGVMEEDGGPFSGIRNAGPGGGPAAGRPPHWLCAHHGLFP